LNEDPTSRRDGAPTLDQLSRTTGLPGAMGDIGNWTEPLGLASLYVEACVFALSLYGLARFRRTR
jgi:hypothetical protein